MRKIKRLMLVMMIVFSVLTCMSGCRADNHNDFVEFPKIASYEEALRSCKNL